MRPQIPSGCRVGDAKAAIALFAPRFTELPQEELHVALLDQDHRLQHILIVHGTADQAEVPLRAIVIAALRHSSWGLVMAHNHPGGRPEPSKADLATTRRLIEVARPLDIHLLDHLIFAGEEVVSFRALGLL